MGEPPWGPNGLLPPAVDITTVLGLSEDAVWSLPKGDLRRYFLALQAYARDISRLPQVADHGDLGKDGTTSFTTPPLKGQCDSGGETGVASLVQAPTQNVPQVSPPSSSRLLSLPPEIRRLILSFLLGPSTSPPSQQAFIISTSHTTSAACLVRGPHPRPLQTPLSLSLRFDPSVLRSCRALYADGAAAFYGAPAQVVHATVDYDVWAHRKRRSDLAVGPAVRSAIRNVHVHVFLGSEKRTTRPGRGDAAARLEVVRKGVRKLGKWLGGGNGEEACSGTASDAAGTSPGEGCCSGAAGPGGGLARLHTLWVSWQEPPQTYTWEQKRSVLDEFRSMRPLRVEVGEINWGLSYPGKKFRFDAVYLKELEYGTAVGFDATTSFLRSQPWR